MKEPLTNLFFAFSIIYFYKTFVLRRKKFRYVLILIPSMILLYIIKSYILFVLLPSLLMLLFFTKRQNIRSKEMRFLATPILIMILCLFLFLSLSVLSRYSERYDVEKILTYLKEFQDYSKSMSAKYEGTTYDINNFDGTLLGLVASVPESINVSLFRPYVWELKKPILIPNAIESLLVMFISIFVFLKVGVIRSVKFILKSPDLIFIFTFSFGLLFFVGLASLNFGTLVRYKIFGISFYLLGISYIYAKNKIRIKNRNYYKRLFK